VDKWDEKAATNKTWSNFKTHFQLAYERYIKSQETLLANNAMIQADVEVTQNDAAHLVAATSNTEDQIAALTQPISEMGIRATTAQANNANTKAVNNTTNKNQLLQEQAEIIEKRKASAKKNRNNNNNNNNDSRTPANQDPPRAQRRFPGNRNYCWSCGFDIANKHTGTTCLFEKYGHIDTATVTNPEGGSQQEMHLINA
jgi:hypothetical protein